MIKLYCDIIEKLENYLVEQLGFVRERSVLKKTLNPDEYRISPTVLNNILNKKIFRRMATSEVLENTLVENYISEVVMEGMTEKIEWTSEEKAFFTAQDDSEAEEERSYQGWSDIEAWVYLQEITIDPKELNEFVKTHKNKTRKESKNNEQNQFRKKTCRNNRHS